MENIRHPKSFAERVLAGVISSGIDVDKVAYLREDSLMTGVGYGLGIDIDALLSSLKVPEEADIRGGVFQGRPVIAISDKGLPAAESVELARLWMLRRVYWHHTSRAMMAMCKFVISQLLQNQLLDFPTYFGETLFLTDVEAAKWLAILYDQSVDNGRLKGGRDPITPCPIWNLLGGERSIYKRLITIPGGPEAANKDLHTVIRRRSLQELDEVTEDVVSTIEGFLGKESTVKRGEVLIDVPRKRRNEQKAKVLVYLRNHKAPLDLREASPVLHSYEAEFEIHLKKIRVFIHPALYEAMKSQVDGVREAVETELRSRLT